MITGDILAGAISVATGAGPRRRADRTRHGAMRAGVNSTLAYCGADVACRYADRRHRPGPPRPGISPPRQVELLQTFAEQAVIAISSAETYRELQARTAALAARNSEYGERIEQQSATIDVLKAMSASPAIRSRFSN